MVFHHVPGASSMMGWENLVRCQKVSKGGLCWDDSKTEVEDLVFIVDEEK